MKWYTVKWREDEAGKILEHFVRKSEAKEKMTELENSGFEPMMDINVVDDRKDLVWWLNNNFVHDNG